MASSPFRKYPIYTREGTETHGNKLNYEGTKNSHTKRSHGEKYIQIYKDKEKPSNKDK